MVKSIKESQAEDYEVPSKLIPLMNNLTIQEASIIKGRLESYGIESFVFDDQMTSLYAQSLGGVKIMILEEDLLKAQEILKNDS